MSIEFVGISANPSAGAKIERTHGQNADKAGGVENAKEKNGFASVLSSVESDAPVAEKGAGTPEGGSQADKKVLEDEKVDTTASTSPDASLLMAQNLPSDLAMLLAQAAHMADKKTGMPLSSTASDARKMSAKGIVALTDAAQTGKAEVTGKMADALLAQVTPDVTGGVLTTRVAQLQSAVAANLAEAKSLNRAAQMDLSARESALSVGLVASGMAEGVARPVDKDFGKPSSLATAPGAEGVWGAHALHAGNQVDSPPVIADPSMISPEQMVADTVGYWVSQGIQKAELKLDGFGSDPVQVSISLNGDEAHIGFRTDQPEIRQILEGAASQLKDLLSNEGLVLSGVSVGGSGPGGNADSQDQRGQQSARQATVLTKEVAPAEARQRANPSIGRALDLFV